MSVNTANGAKLYIGTSAAVAVPDAITSANLAATIAAFELDSYVEVGEIEDLGEFGDMSEAVKFTALSDGRARTFKGARDAGTMPIVVGDDMLDSGQTAMEAAEAQPYDYNFYVQLNDAVSIGGDDSKHYFIGKVMSKRRNVGSANNVVRRNFSVAINSAIASSDPS